MQDATTTKRNLCIYDETVRQVPLEKESGYHGRMMIADAVTAHYTFVTMLYLVGVVHEVNWDAERQ